MSGTPSCADQLAPPLHPVPRGAWDCHIHVFDRRFAVHADTLFTPPDAGLAAYEQVQRRLGLERVLIVQSSAYGTDNSCMVDALRRQNGRGRGVALVGRDTKNTTLADLSRSGVRAIRLLMVPGGVVPWADVPLMAERVQAFGWHLNLQIDGRELPDRLTLLRRLPGKLVIDHFGMFGDPIEPNERAFRALLDLVSEGRTWVKLSAPYAGGRAGPPPYPHLAPLVKALIKVGPDRLMWGSNWPHPFTTQVRHLPAEDDAMLLDLLHDWTDDEKTLHSILVDTPEALFGA